MTGCLDNETNSSFNLKLFKRNTCKGLHQGYRRGRRRDKRGAFGFDAQVCRVKGDTTTPGKCGETMRRAHLSLDKGLGSGRRTISALPVRVAGGDLGKLVSREPDFLCKGSSPMAPDMSLSMGQEPARPCDAMGQEPERA